MASERQQVEAALKKITGLDFKYHANELTGYVWLAANEADFIEKSDLAGGVLKKKKISRKRGESPMAKAIESLCDSLSNNVFYEEPLSIVVLESFINVQNFLNEAEAYSGAPLFPTGKAKGKTHWISSLLKIAASPQPNEVEEALFNALGLRFKFDESLGFGQYKWEASSYREYDCVYKNAENYLCQIGYKLQRGENALVEAIQQICPLLEGVVHEGFLYQNGRKHVRSYIYIEDEGISKELLNFSSSKGRSVSLLSKGITKLSEQACRDKALKA